MYRWVRGDGSGCRWSGMVAGAQLHAVCQCVGHDDAVNHAIPSDRLMRRMLIALSFCAIGPQVNANWLGRSGFVTNYGCSATASPFHVETVGFLQAKTDSGWVILQSIYSCASIAISDRPNCCALVLPMWRVGGRGPDGPRPLLLLLGMAGGIGKALRLVPSQIMLRCTHPGRQGTVVDRHPIGQAGVAPPAGLAFLNG